MPIFSNHFWPPVTSFSEKVLLVHYYDRSKWALVSKKNWTKNGYSGSYFLDLEISPRTWALKKPLFGQFWKIFEKVKKTRFSKRVFFRVFQIAEGICRVKKTEIDVIFEKRRKSTWFSLFHFLRFLRFLLFHVFPKSDFLQKSKKNKKTVFFTFFLFFLKIK